MILGLWGCAYPAAAYYDPGVQRWVNRDPFADYGFQELLSDNLSTWRRHDNGNLYTFADNAPSLYIDAFGLVAKGCTRKQEESIKAALKKSCEKAKECAKKCSNSKETGAGVEKACDNSNYQFQCAHKDNPRCQSSGLTANCGYALVGGNEMMICPAAFDPKSGCGKDVGCTIFHEAIHSGGLSHEPNHPSDFNEMEKCMGCPQSKR